MAEKEAYKVPCELTGSYARALDQNGFVVIDGLVSPAVLRSLADTYDLIVRDACPPELRVGRTTTRVHGLVNYGAEFEALTALPPVLAACRHIIKQPFTLSVLLARTLHPRTGSQDLHVDVARDGHGWPMAGLILMLDDFRDENGATRFVPGSHHSSKAATSYSPVDAVPACGRAGAVIVYNGSVVHGHGTNETGRPRRSIQGAYVRRGTATDGVHETSSRGNTPRPDPM